MTKVKFLLDTDQPAQIFAFFPDDKYNDNPNLFTSYAHIGQHSACHIDYANECKPASQEQYTPLLKELTQIGYKLKIL